MVLEQAAQAGAGVTAATAVGLTADELEAFDAMTPVDQAEYVRLMEQAVGDVWSLTPKQQFAIALWGKVDWLLYGGSAGGGKSEMACWHANDLSERIPGHTSLLIRKAIPELRRSLILRMIARSKQYRIRCKLRKPDGISGFYYDNTSLVECGYLASEEHVGQYLSAEYDLIIIDEASQLEQEWIVQLAARLRTTKAKAARGARCHLGMFTNPGDRGHAWLYNTFVTPTGYGDKVVVYNITEGIEKATVVRTYAAPIPVRDATPQQIDDVLIPWITELDPQVDPQTELAVAFVPSRATDNPHIEPSYMKVLNALPERKRKQMRDGDWDTFDGMFFPEFSRDLHVVEPFRIPDGWVKARALDYGTAKPYACLWGAWDGDGDAWIYRERYGKGFDPDQQAKQVLDASRPVDLETGRTIVESYQHTVADPSVFSNHRGVGRSVADLWQNAGLHVSRARNDRVAGWSNVKQYLRPTDADGNAREPLLHIFSTCTNLLRTLPMQQTDKSNGEDLDSDLEDHAADALRYLLAIRPVGAKPPKVWTGNSANDRFTRFQKKHDKRTHR